MKKIIYIAILLFFIFIYIGGRHLSNATLSPKEVREKGDQNRGKSVSEQRIYHTPEDSMIDLILDKYREDDGEDTYYYNKSKNTKQIVPPGFYMVPDSIAYVKTYYKNGNFSSEGLLVYFDDPQMDDAMEVGLWKYCTPDGTTFEKYYNYTIGVAKDLSH